MNLYFFRPVRRLGLAVIAGLTALLCIVSVNSAVVTAAPEVITWSVNTTADNKDFKPGDGICEISPNTGHCTLRAAIEESNAHAGKEVIKLQDDAYLTNISVQYEIKGEVDIIGMDKESTYVSGKQNNRVFDIRPGAKVRLYNMTVADGYLKQDGGANISVTNASLTIVNSVVRDGLARNGGGIAITAGSTVEILYSQIQGNQATSAGGIYNLGKLTMVGSTLYNNEAANGGGIATGGQFTAVNSTFYYNRASNDGGAILSSHFAGDSVALYNVTIHENFADSNHNQAGDGGGIYVADGAHASIASSILAGNRDESPQATPNSYYKAHDCAGHLTSAGYNLLGNNYGCTGLTDAVNGDQVGSPAQELAANLGAPDYNGGQTTNLPLLPNSPAIDAGNPAGCVDGASNMLLTIDQRTFARPLNGGSGVARCDMGSYEYVSPQQACVGKKPGVPVLSNPTNNAQVETKRVGLNWRDAACATFYNVAIRQDGAHGVKVQEVQVTKSEFVTKALAKGHTYYWTVQACSSKGNCAKSAVYSFSIK